MADIWQVALAQVQVPGGVWLIPVIIIALIILANAFRIVKEYERGVVLRLGRYHKTKEPGLRLIFPWVDKMTKIPIRIVTMDVPDQEIITKDNVSVSVNAVVYFRVMDPEKAFLEVEEYLQATSQIAQTTLRSVLGQAMLDEVLSARDELSVNMQEVVDKLTDPWGVKVTGVEIKHVELTEQLTRAMAREAEAERERRAKVIHADGEFEASKRLSEAAGVLATEPAALQLRYLQTLTEISVEKNSTIIFPLPIEVIKPLMTIMDKKLGGKKEE